MIPRPAAALGNRAVCYTKVNHLGTWLLRGHSARKCAGRAGVGRTKWAEVYKKQDQGNENARVHRDLPGASKPRYPSKQLHLPSPAWAATTPPFLSPLGLQRHVPPTPRLSCDSTCVPDPASVLPDRGTSLALQDLEHYIVPSTAWPHCQGLYGLRFGFSNADILSLARPSSALSIYACFFVNSRSL